MTKEKKLSILFVIMIYLLIGINSFSMHIMEGYLPLQWSVIWFVICIPFWIIGMKKITKITKGNINQKLLLGIAGAFIFLLSSLKIPSVTGSSSHPTGVGLSAILYGPYVTSILGTIVLIFQAGLLAHGGFTTLGANAFSMSIVGPFISYIVYKLLKNKNRGFAIFLAAALGNLSTYIVTSIQLSLAIQSPEGGFIGSLIKFLMIFAVTQIPLAIIEGFLTNIIINMLDKYSKNGNIEEEIEAEVN